MATKTNLYYKKSTKGFHRYEADDIDGTSAVTTVYVRRSALSKVPDPEIIVTIQEKCEVSNVDG